MISMASLRPLSTVEIDFVDAGSSEMRSWGGMSGSYPRTVKRRVELALALVALWVGCLLHTTNIVADVFELTGLHHGDLRKTGSAKKILCCWKIFVAAIKVSQGRALKVTSGCWLSKNLSPLTNADTFYLVLQAQTIRKPVIPLLSHCTKVSFDRHSAHPWPCILLKERLPH